MKKVILIDMENMQREGYSQIPQLKPGDYEIVFFESDYTAYIPNYIEREMQEKGIDYSFEWVQRNPLNKDTMDFQMVAHLALRCRLVPSGTEEYYILSKDTDFKLPGRYIAEEAGVDVYLIKTLNALIDNKNITEKRMTVEYIINSCIKEARSKQHLHCLLQQTLKKYYNSSDIGAIYHDVLPRFTKHMRNV